MRDLHTTETTGHERFPSGHGTNYFRFVLTFSFFYKQTIIFRSHLFTGLSDFEINYKAHVPGEMHATVQRLKSVFEKQNRNVSKISFSLACCWQIGSKFTNHSRIARCREGWKVTLVAAIGGFRSDLSITRKTDENFGNVNAGVLFSKVAYRSTKTVVSYAWSQV